MTDKTILIVDDDQGHLGMLSTVLKDWGYAVKEAVNGLEAVEFCARKPAPDLVLLDVRMPKLSGTEALKMIRAADGNIPVVMMTAFSEIPEAVEAMRAGALDYVAKPLNFDRLKSLLEKLFTTTKAWKEINAQGLLPGKSAAIQNLNEMIRAVAPSEATILITGESGTGKELAARALHAGSPRRKGPFVAINCGAFSETLLVSELFGHEKGAFTGAEKQRPGLFAEASGGTLLLDEIGEMPLSMQVKLLRVLQEREVLSVGAQKPKPLDCRILAATNRDLVEEVRAGRFREDLYYRLNVVNLKMPPLRDRKEDIPELAENFAKRFAIVNRKPFQAITNDTMHALLDYDWPGNVRELENVMERAIVLMNGDFLSPRYLPDRFNKVISNRVQNNENSLAGNAFSFSLTNPTPTLEEIEKAVILQTLERCGQNKSDAARILGISRKTLHAKLNRYRMDVEHEA